MIIVLNSFIVVKIVKSSNFRKKIMQRNEGFATTTNTTQTTELETFLEVSPLPTLSRKSSNNSERSDRKSTNETPASSTENKLRKEMGNNYLSGCFR